MSNKINDDFEVNDIGTASALAALRQGAGTPGQLLQIGTVCEVDGETVGRAYGVSIEKNMHGELCLMIFTDPIIAAHVEGAGDGLRLLRSTVR